ncbi:AraC family transcriptional regulator [Massilia sp. G4R7]|uniref:AraC family transcriptional regulator n=1 Tax=Massilia phyllostachyos TaxID=2898585 RepID=A0ABS8Q8Y8_9BURK|nr:AraC family transcriptional regulator [Massilia phyllostachyos]MCD2517070.1 AraC family transcriptional regulator [Massilia phyllostachyos]
MNDRKRTIELLAGLAPREGYNLTGLPGVRLLRSNRPLQRTPVLYAPGIVIVCQGSKQGYFGGEIYRYDAQHYLAVAVPVPFTMETMASEAEPLLAIYLHLDVKLAADLMLEIAQHDFPAKAAARSMWSTPMNEALAATVLRLVQALSSPAETAILSPGLLRELYYRALTGEQGAAIRAALAQRGKSGRIVKALRCIHTAYRENLSVEQLAAEAGMSVPTFYSHFRTVTGTSPMQYLKSTRLHQARLLMVRNDKPAAVAAAEVGYESASQFGREFKRMFGRTPALEAKRMKSTFAFPPHANTEFVSSH